MGAVVWERCAKQAILLGLKRGWFPFLPPHRPSEVVIFERAVFPLSFFSFVPIVFPLAMAVLVQRQLVPGEFFHNSWISQVLMRSSVDLFSGLL